MDSTPVDRPRAPFGGMPIALLGSVSVASLSAPAEGTAKDEPFGDPASAILSLPSRWPRPVSTPTDVSPTPALPAQVGAAAGDVSLDLWSPVGPRTVHPLPDKFTLPVRTLTRAMAPFPTAVPTPAEQGPVYLPPILPPQVTSAAVVPGVPPCGDPGVDQVLAVVDVEAERATPRRRMTTGTRQRGIVITDRDIRMLQFLARYKYATYPQLAAYLQVEPDALRRRLPRLRVEGILAFKSVGRPSKVWVPTRTGIALSGLDLTVPETSLATGKHSAALVDLGIRFEQGGERVVTEREIRAADVRGRLTDRMLAARALTYPNAVLQDLPARVDGPPLFSVTMGSGERYRHIPDMVLVRPPAPDGSPGSIAIELELCRKTRSLWRQIFNAYSHQENIGLVVYFTHRRELSTALTSTIKDMGLERLILVKKYVASDHSPALTADD